MRKKEKQNSRRDSLHKEWVYLDSYADKIEHLLTMEQPILSGDERAVWSLIISVFSTTLQNSHSVSWLPASFTRQD